MSGIFTVIVAIFGVLAVLVLPIILILTLGGFLAWAFNLSLFEGFVVVALLLIANNCRQS